MERFRYILWGGVALLAGASIGLYADKFSGTHHAAMLPEFSLFDHDGAPLGNAEVTAGPSAIFFGFTHCPEVCPTTLADLAAIREDAGITPDQLQYYFVTLDPERDKGELLKDYLGYFGTGVTGITGPEAEILSLADRMNVYAKKVGSADSYLFDHTADVFLIDRSGYVIDRIPYGTSHEEMARRIKALI